MISEIKAITSSSRFIIVNSEDALETTTKSRICKSERHSSAAGEEIKKFIHIKVVLCYL